MRTQAPRSGQHRQECPPHLSFPTCSDVPKRSGAGGLRETYCPRAWMNVGGRARTKEEVGKVEKRVPANDALQLPLHLRHAAQRLDVHLPKRVQRRQVSSTRVRRGRAASTRMVRRRVYPVELQGGHVGKVCHVEGDVGHHAPEDRRHWPSRTRSGRGTTSTGGRGAGPYLVGIATIRTRSRLCTKLYSMKRSSSSLACVHVRIMTMIRDCTR